MKQYFYLIALLTTYCHASQLEHSPKVHASWKEKTTEAGKTLVKYGTPFVAYDFLKNYSLYYGKNKGQLFSHKKAIREVGKATAQRAAKRAFFVYPALVLYESLLLNAKLKRGKLPEKD